MKKVLHIVEPLVSGIHTFLVNLTNHQCNDYDVYIAYSIRPQTPKDFKNYYDNRIHWIRVRNFQQSLAIKDVKAFFELKRIMHEIKPDIVHLHSSKAGFLGRWAFNCSKYQIYYTPNGFSFLMHNISTVKHILYWFCEYIAAKRNAIIVACGRGEYEEALKLSKKSLYVNNGVNIGSLKPFLKVREVIHNPPIVCTTGRITFQKNPKLFNQIARLLPQVKFWWIGEGELRGDLTSANIEITGWLNQKQTLELLSFSDFFLLPSLWEGLPLSLLEAMYLKKICLVSDVVGNQDAIENGRNGLICHTAEEYVQRISQIINNRYDWKLLTEEAHNDVITIYNSYIMANKYIEIYNSN